VSPGRDLSLVICTRNRAERLRESLRAVAAIRTARPWEVVLVDNGSTDETGNVVEAARDFLPVPLQLVEEHAVGVTRARNRGWRATSAAVVFFTDDDCYPLANVVDLVLDRFEQDGTLGFVAGAVELHDPTDARLATVTRREPVAFEPGGFVTPGSVLSANLAFRRTVLEAIGGFDEIFAYGRGPGGGDVDAVARALAAGHRGLYDPTIVVRHHHRRKLGSEANEARRAYDVGRGMFYAKCLLDRRLRRTYIAGWLVLTWGRIRRRESLRPVARELWGAGSYLAARVRGRGVRSGSGGP
jgi:glycosyltransferase involved in cell wall biosynthesis